MFYRNLNVLLYVRYLIPLNSVIKPWAYIMTNAFFGRLIHGGAYIRGAFIHGRKIALRLKVRVFS